MVFLAAYVASIVAANWLLQTVGVVPVLGLAVPAGTFAAGFAFTLRDLTQERLGRGWSVAAIALGTAVSALVSPALALASCLAFSVSEGLDFLAYQPLRERRPLLAVTLSNTVGLVADSVLFLALAFGSLEYLPGQVAGKAAATAAAVIGLRLLRWNASTWGRTRPTGSRP